MPTAPATRPGQDNRAAGSAAQTGWRPARVAKLGALATSVGFALVMLAAALAPKSEVEQLQYAFESMAGSPRSQILELAATLGSVSFVAGLAALAFAGIWALVRAGRRPAAS